MVERYQTGGLQICTYAAMYIQKYADGRIFSWDRRKSEANFALESAQSPRDERAGRSVLHMKRQSKAKAPGRGRADLDRLRRMSDIEVRDSSPPELSGLPSDFWDSAELVEPVRKQAVSLRIDEDVLEWFRQRGPRYQSRMNAVLRSYMNARSRGRARP